jgi:hypothetical protein
MSYHIFLTVTILAVLAVASPGWTQQVPDANPKLAPTINPKNPTSVESLAAYSQELTREISQAHARGKDTSAAEAERAQGERSMQQGNQREAVRHFQAGEQALGMSESQPAKAPSDSSPPPTSDR